MREERWTIVICPNCRRLVTATENGTCDHCDEWLGGEGTGDEDHCIDVEVVDASLYDSVRRRLAEIEAEWRTEHGPHVLVLSSDRWTLEHSLACRESGHMAECEVHERIAAWIDKVGEPDLPKGRYRVSAGLLPDCLHEEGSGA